MSPPSSRYLGVTHRSHAVFDRQELFVRVNIQVAIDGPAGAGKSTVARLVAQRLRLTYIDSGAMYRSLALMAVRRAVDPDDEEGLAALADALDVTFSSASDGQLVTVGSEDVTDLIRSADIGRLAPLVARHRSVRDHMVARQRRLADHCDGVVMDGRDIGTHVLPHAQVKIYQTASLDTRAARRYAELAKYDSGLTQEDVRKTVHARDKVDGTRTVAPMRPADDAVIVDTTALSVSEAVAMIAALCEERRMHLGER